MFLGLEWPSLLNPLTGTFQHNLPSINIEQHIQDENCLLDDNTNHHHHHHHHQHHNQLNETLLIADRITNSIQSGAGILNDNLILNDRIDELIQDNQNDIVIDPDLLTLKPKTTIDNI